MEPTQQQKADVLEHVRYEIGGLFPQVRVNPSDVYMSNIVLEAFLLHVRALIGFFESKSRWKDSVIPADFGFCQREVPIPDDIETRLNKDLAHITYSRLHQKTTPDKRWNFRSIIPCLLPIWIELAEHITSSPPERTSDDGLEKWGVLLRQVLLPYQHKLYEEPARG